MEVNANVPHNTEDKMWWYEKGVELEEAFIKHSKEYGLDDAKINPEKATDKKVPDLIVGGRLAELKTRNTPFFTAGRYKFDPQYTITFNLKDYERYREKYPDLDIYFLVEWTQLQYGKYSVRPLKAVYKAPFSLIAKIIESGKAPLHSYERRQNDTQGNAKSSFLLDVRQFQQLVYFQ